MGSNRVGMLLVGCRRSRVANTAREGQAGVTAGFYLEPLLLALDKRFHGFNGKKMVKRSAHPVAKRHDACCK